MIREQRGMRTVGDTIFHEHRAAVNQILVAKQGFGRLPGSYIPYHQGTVRGARQHLLSVVKHPTSADQFLVAFQSLRQVSCTGAPYLQSLITPAAQNLLLVREPAAVEYLTLVGIRDSRDGVSGIEVPDSK